MDIMTDTVFGDIYISRTNKSDSETLGMLRVQNNNQILTLSTLELPWKNNEENISCIPVGTYRFEKWYSPTFKRIVLRLLNIPNRDNVLIHPANFVRQLRGCITPGLGLEDIDGDGLLDVEKSISALENLLAVVNDTGYIHIS